jgi:hypothetical protein
MNDAAKRLAQNRQAILEHVARKQRRHDPREERSARGSYEQADAAPEFDDEPPPSGGGWFGHLRHAARTWWRYHPAHMAVDIATPLMQNYARRKPLQLLGISLAAGAALTLMRPWKVISVTTILLAVLKSSQLSHLFMAAMSAADYRKDHNRPE